MLTLQYRNKNIVNDLQNVGSNFPQERQAALPIPVRYGMGHVEYM